MKMRIRSQIPCCLAAALAMALAAGCGGEGSGQQSGALHYTVKRGPLRISVKENAELQAARETRVRSELEGQATLIFLIPEGRTVEQGEKLAELDASSLIERKANQQIALAKAEAALVQARKEQEIKLKQIASDILSAKNLWLFAKMELEKYVGQHPTDPALQLSAPIEPEEAVLTEAEIRVSQDSVDWSMHLAAQLEREREAAQRAAEKGASAKIAAEPPGGAPMLAGGASPASSAAPTTVPAPAGPTGGPAANVAGPLRAAPSDLPPADSPRNGQPAAGVIDVDDAPPAHDDGLHLADAAPPPEAPLAPNPTTELPGAAVTPARRAPGEMGEAEQKIQAAVDKITLALAELKMAEDRLQWSRKLAAKGFIMKNELDRDQLDFDRKKSQVALAKNELDLLVRYEIPKERLELEQKLREARTDLDRVKAQGDAQKAQALAAVTSCEAEYTLSKERYENLQHQIENAVLRAPTPGLVVYAPEGDGRRQQFVEEGMQVRERQTLIILPDITSMVANLRVKEAHIDKVRVGQPALVRVDARPGLVLRGTVSRVSPLPDSGSRWSNPDQKEYKTEVELHFDNSANELSPGLTASVEIIVDELQDVLTVPIQALQRDRAVHYVWLQTPEGPVDRRVEIGASDYNMVQIVSGLEAGQQVWLVPPPGVQAPQFEQPKTMLPEARPVAGDAAPAGEASPNSGRGPAGPGTGDGPGEGQARPGGNRRRTTNPEAQALIAQIKQKHPELAEVVDSGGMMALMRDERVRAAIDADPELKAKLEAMQTAFRAARGPGGQRGERRERGAAGEGGGGGGGEGGERGPRGGRNGDGAADGGERGGERGERSFERGERGARAPRGGDGGGFPRGNRGGDGGR